MSELKKLTWKYFWEQKLIEVIIGLVIIAAIMFISYLVGICLPDWQQITIGPDNPCYLNHELDCGLGFWDYWITGLLMSVMGGIILGLIGKGLYEWIRFNWEKASSRAEKKLDKVDEELYDLNKETIL